MLSRGMIFNAFALLFGIYKFSKKIKHINKINYYIKSAVVIFVLFYLSVISVNYIRANFFYVGKSAEFTIEKFKAEEETTITKKRKYATSYKSDTK